MRNPVRENVYVTKDNRKLILLRHNIQVLNSSIFFSASGRRRISSISQLKSSGTLYSGSNLMGKYYSASTSFSRCTESPIEIEEFSVPEPAQCCISRVPKNLRRINEDAYTPHLISIGPFHHGKEDLGNMEKEKRRYKEKFIQRLADQKWEELKTFVENNEQKIRCYYSEPLKFPKAKFVEIILYDAVFIIELFLRYERGDKVDDFLLNKLWLRAITTDFLLLENQLPFFVLEELYNLAFPQPPEMEPAPHQMPIPVTQEPPPEAYPSNEEGATTSNVTGATTSNTDGATTSNPDGVTTSTTYEVTIDITDETTASNPDGAINITYEATASNPDGAIDITHEATASNPDGAIDIAYEATTSKPGGAIAYEAPASNPDGATYVAYEATASNTDGATNITYEATTSNPDGATGNKYEASVSYPDGATDVTYEATTSNTDGATGIEYEASVSYLDGAADVTYEATTSNEDEASASYLDGVTDVAYEATISNSDGDATSDTDEKLVLPTLHSLGIDNNNEELKANTDGASTASDRDGELIPPSPTLSNPRFRKLSCKFFVLRFSQKIREIKVKHFTDLYRHALAGTKSKGKSKSKGATTESLPTRENSHAIDMSEIHPLVESKRRIALPNAVKLQELGVKLRRLDTKSPFEVVLKRAELRIPCIKITDETECLIRNVMALEQCHYPSKTFICSYIRLMNFLIYSEEDVNLLVKQKIIENFVGASAVIVDMFNKLGRQIPQSDYCYAGILKPLRARFDNPCNRFKVQVRLGCMKTLPRVIGAVMVFAGLKFIRV